MLPCTLPVFRKEFPEVRISVKEANSAILEGMILEGEIDLAFFTLPIRRPDVVYDIIKEEEVVLVMSAAHPLAGSGIRKRNCKYPWLDMKKLQDETIIMQRLDQRTRHIADQILRNANISPRNSLEIRNILASVKLAAEGYGITFVSETHLRHIPLQHKPACFSVGNPKTVTCFVAAYRRGMYLPHYAQRYVQIVREFT
jgi:DNA-binding transcriptional LysR family regulator